MEAAAKTVELLTQRILPQEPHHLSYSPDWRYRQPPNKPNKPSKPNKPARFDEWHNTRLQYLTFVSDADRGVLLTRPDYDMREEIPKPAPREVNALAKGGEKKKLSLSDYKKKTTGATSTSPPEPAIAKRKDIERVSPSATEAASAADMKRAADPKRASDARRSDGPMSRERDSSSDGKPQRSRDNSSDTKLPFKPPTKHPLPPKPPTPEAKKRLADADDESRPHKRPKPDTRRSHDGSQSSRDDPPRRRDRDSLPSSALPSSQRDGKTSSSSLLNGRSILKDAMGTSRNPSPVSRSRGNSVNGVRPGATGAARSTPSKLDTPSKTSVPPLLSPLNLDLDGNDDESVAKAERRRRDDAADAARPAKPKKLEAPPVSKKQKSPLRLPPLLSPTLPPEVEAELRKKKTPPKTSEGKYREDRDEPLPVKKVRAEQADEEREEPPRRKSLMVTLKIHKRLRQDVKRILALSSRKEPQRPANLEAPQPGLARKRPSGVADTPAESMAAKRPRASEMAGPNKLPAPSTPSKKGPATMSRVSSSNSLANTPGVGPGATPSAERGADSQNDPSDVVALKEREGRLSRLGKRLKHDGDELLKSHHATNATNGNVRPSETNVKLAHVYTLESIIAFMASFQTQNKYRALAHKPSIPSGWSSMFPLMEQRRSEMRRYPPLFALLLLLHAVSLEEAVKCYWTFGDPASQISVSDVAKFERSRNRALTQLRETLAGIDSPALRLDVHPWSTVDEVSEACLRVMRRYCADEKVEWQPEVNLKESGHRAA